MTKFFKTNTMENGNIDNMTDTERNLYYLKNNIEEIKELVCDIRVMKSQRIQNAALDILERCSDKTLEKFYDVCKSIESDIEV